MAIIVQKFGGTSVADINGIKNVARIIKSEYISGNQVIVVVSAMAGTTNSLIAQCRQVSSLDNSMALREYDSAIASGEILTSALLALELQRLKLTAKSMQGWQVPIITDNVNGNARITDIPAKKLKNIVINGIIPVITGFQGMTETGSVTTFGKGGSDTTAAVIAGSVGAKRCDIYTDVDGIYSADPRLVYNAKKIDEININELCALCSSGAKVLHPRAAIAAKKYGFKLKILSSFFRNKGTTVTIHNLLYMEKRQVTAITSNKDLLKIDINYQNNGLYSVCKELASNSIEIEQISTIDTFSSYLIANLCDKAQCNSILERLKKDKKIASYKLISNISTVTIVGYGIKNDSSLIWKLIDILYENNIQIISSQADNIKISVLINDQHNERVVRLLHANFCQFN